MVNAAGITCTGQEVDSLSPPEMASFQICGWCSHNYIFFKDKLNLWSWPGTDIASELALSIQANRETEDYIDTEAVASVHTHPAAE